MADMEKKIILLKNKEVKKLPSISPVKFVLAVVGLSLVGAGASLGDVAGTALGVGGVLATAGAVSLEEE